MNIRKMTGFIFLPLCLVAVMIGFLSAPHTARAAAEAAREPGFEWFDRTYTDFLVQMPNYDFSSVYRYGDDDQQEFLGFIGNDFQRFYIYFTSIRQSLDNPLVYHVTGKTRVKKNVCTFTGTLTHIWAGLWTDIDESEPQLGNVQATLELFEEKNQPGSGTIKGTLRTEFQINKGGTVGIHEDSPSESQDFVGTWTSYKTGAKKVCNFGHDRIRYDGLPEGLWLDQGRADEFMPKKEYWDKGWKVYVDCLYATGDLTPVCQYEKEWWKLQK